MENIGFCRAELLHSNAIFDALRAVLIFHFMLFGVFLAGLFDNKTFGLYFP